jgi:hypothetical protein
MKGTIIAVEVDHGETGKLEQGIKNMAIPDRAVAGSNGSFICAGSNQLRVDIELENGDIFFYDITELAKHIKDWKRLTEKRINLLQDGLLGEVVDVEFNGDMVRRIHGLEEAIEEV